MVADMNTGTMVAPHVRRVTVHGRTVHIIDMTSNDTGTGTEHYDNFALPPAPVETLRRLLRHMPAPWPRLRIPWTRPQHWVHPLVHPDFPYCRGKLAATCITMRWLILSKPIRAEP